MFERMLTHTAVVSTKEATGKNSIGHSTYSETSANVACFLSSKKRKTEEGDSVTQLFIFTKKTDKLRVGDEIEMITAPDGSELIEKACIITDVQALMDYKGIHHYESNISYKEIQ